MKLVKNIYLGIYLDKPDFDMYDVIEYLKNHPELNKLNSEIIKEQTL